MNFAAITHGIQLWLSCRAGINTWVVPNFLYPRVGTWIWGKGRDGRGATHTSMMCCLEQDGSAKTTVEKVIERLVCLPVTSQSGICWKGEFNFLRTMLLSPIQNVQYITMLWSILKVWSHHPQTIIIWQYTFLHSLPIYCFASIALIVE